MMEVKQVRLMASALDHLLYGFRFRSAQIDPKTLGCASIYFPVIGLVFGSGFMVAYALFSKIVSLDMAALLTLILMLVIFNGNQCRACWRLVEKFGRNNSKIFADQLKRNVRTLLMFFTLFMLKWLALKHLGQGWIFGLLVIVPTLSCWSWVYMAHSFSMQSRTSADTCLYYVGKKEFWGATVVATIVAGVFMELEGLFLLMYISFFTAILEWWVVRGKKGDMVDMLGATMEINEILILLGALAMRKMFYFFGGVGIWL